MGGALGRSSTCASTDACPPPGAVEALGYLPSCCVAARGPDGCKSVCPVLVDERRRSHSYQWAAPSRQQGEVHECVCNMPDSLRERQAQLDRDAADWPQSLAEAATRLGSVNVKTLEHAAIAAHAFERTPGGDVTRSVGVLGESHWREIAYAYASRVPDVAIDDFLTHLQQGRVRLPAVLPWLVVALVLAAVLAAFARFRAAQNQSSPRRSQFSTWPARVAPHVFDDDYESGGPPRAFGRRDVARGGRLASPPAWSAGGGGGSRLGEGARDESGGGLE